MSAGDLFFALSFASGFLACAVLIYVYFSWDRHAGFSPEPFPGTCVVALAGFAFFPFVNGIVALIVYTIYLRNRMKDTR